MSNQFNEALKYINSSDLSNFNLKKAEKLMREAAEEGFFVAQAYMVVFSLINQNDREKELWLEKVRKVNPQIADLLVIQNYSIDSPEWQKVISNYKCQPGQFSSFYNLERYLKMLNFNLER